MRYQVIESRMWKRDDGRTASIYGACPWTSSPEKSRWTMVIVGWTVRDTRLGTIGIGRLPWSTESEARAWADSHD